LPAAAEEGRKIEGKKIKGGMAGVGWMFLPAIFLPFKNDSNVEGNGMATSCPRADYGDYRSCHRDGPALRRAFILGTS
jgi:hypothetical protein